MNLTEILKAEAVKAVSSVSSKKRLFHEVADMMSDTYGVAQPKVVSALMERESLGPTGVGHGVALPHARIPDLDQIVGGFMRLERPVEFAAVDRQPVDIIFCLLAPEGAGVDHLKALALVSRTLRDTNTRSKLRANMTPTSLHAILTEVATDAAA